MTTPRLIPSDASLNHLISTFEQFGTRGCPDCEVGEPHCCPLQFRPYQAEQRRLYPVLAAGDSRDA